MGLQIEGVQGMPVVYSTWIFVSETSPARACAETEGISARLCRTRQRDLGVEIVVLTFNKDIREELQLKWDQNYRRGRWGSEDLGAVGFQTFHAFGLQLLVKWIGKRPLTDPAKTSKVIEAIRQKDSITRKHFKVTRAALSV